MRYRLMMALKGSGVAGHAALASVALLLVIAAGAFAAGAQHDPPRASRAAVANGAAAKTTPRALVLRVAHGLVTPSDVQYIDASPAGPSVGDVRTYYLPITRRGRDRRIGYLTGALTTVAVDKPTADIELRTANLVFVVGRAADQIVVGGVSAYAQKTPTISKRSVVTRPVIGGSGKYAGARGSCVTTHRSNGTWTHVFHVTADRS